jgi:hypothetical protein
MLSSPGFLVLREFEAKGGRRQVFLHDATNPPTQHPFDWSGKERVSAEGQLAMAIVITHDCEIENEDARGHRLVALVRPTEGLSAEDRDVLIRNKHFGRMYLPALASMGLPESYVDWRRITTLRENALPNAQRIGSMTDVGREILQASFIRYITNRGR